HHAIGCAGEAGEVLDLVALEWVHGITADHRKLVEETGDVAFYFQGLCNYLRTSFAEIRNGDRWLFLGHRAQLARRRGVDGKMHAAVGAATSACMILDMTKKHWVYDKPIARDTALALLSDLLFYLENLAELYGFTLETAIVANIEKLRRRFPDGYTDEAAIAQKDKANG